MRKWVVASAIASVIAVNAAAAEQSAAGTGSASAELTQETRDREIYGWVEKVRIMPLEAVTSAKLDSGALTSSMHAEDIQLVERDGETWVRFLVEVEDKQTGELVSEQLERPLYRDQQVRGAGGMDERPVVLMQICVGNAVYEEQFALRDRGEMNYPVLLGRRTIQHLGLLDVTATFLVTPQCRADSPVHAEDERAPAGNIGSA